MKLQILGGNGLHASEIRALHRMEKELRESWFAYASLLVADDQGSMDVDALIITHDRLLLVELKEWNGYLESSDGRWYLNGYDRGKSPYEIKRVHALRLAKLLKQELEHKLGYFVGVEAHVVLCGSAMPDRLGTSERRFVHTLEEFLKIKDREAYERLVEDHANAVALVFDRLGKPRPNSTSCLPILQQFFAGSRVKPKEFRSNHFVAEAHPWFVHRNRLFSEYKGHHEEVPNEVALMRRWDFTQLGTGYATQSQWAEIALRESRVRSHAKQHNTALEEFLLRPLVPLGLSDISEDITEVYELRRSYSRLDEFLSREARRASPEKRLDWLRALLAPFSELHSLGLAHRDVELHNLWYAADQQSILVSGLAAAFFPEKGTVGDLRELLQGGGCRFPEDVMRTAGDILDPFRMDVFMLTVLACRICYPEEKIVIDSDGIATWSPPAQDPFGGTIREWIEKGLSLDPRDRFANASEMLAVLNGITRASVSSDDDASNVLEALSHGEFIKRGWGPFSLFQQFPPLPGEAPGGGTKVAYRCSHGEREAYCKVWLKVAAEPQSPGTNRRILNFRSRIERVMEGNLPTPAVLNYGLLESGGLFVVTRLEAGVLWSEYCSEICSKKRLVVALALVRAVTVCHEQGIAHGDLHPANLLVRPGALESEARVPEEPNVVLLDLLDFGTSSEPYNLEYGPKNPAAADAFSRDRHAVYKLVRALYLSEQATALQEEIDRGLSQPNEVPVSLAPLQAVLESALAPAAPTLTSEGRELSIAWSSPHFPAIALEIEPDGGGYHFNCKWDRRNSSLLNCYMTGVNASLSIVLDPEQREIRSFRLNSSIALSDLVTASSRATAHITRRLIVVRGVADPVALHELREILFSLDPVISALEEKFAPPLDRNDQVAEEVVPEPGFPIREIWKALLETEHENLLNIEVINGGIEENRSGNLLVPYRLADGRSMDFSMEDLVLVCLEDDDNPVARVDLIETNAETLALHPMRPNLRKQLREGCVLRLESVQNKASRDRRAKALQRVLDRGSVLPNLAEYFDPSASAPMHQYGDPPSESFLREEYDTSASALNPRQVEAFQRLVSQGPIGVLQGPPGTGKTTFIACLIHYLFSVAGAKNILLVGQSHTAVDAVAIKARRLCAEKQFEVAVVRMGQERLIATEMLDTHSRAVQRQLRHSFHREYERRIQVFASKFGVPEQFVHELAVAHRTLFPLTDSATRYRRELEAGTNSATEERSQNLRLQLGEVTELIERIVARRYPDAASQILSSKDVWNAVVEHVAASHDIRNPAAVAKLTGVLALSQEWLGVLRTGEANYDQFLLQTRQLVCGTLVGMGHKQLGLSDTEFDWVIVDEAARAQASELMIPLQSARRVLLVGDHKQLPPHYERAHLRSAAQKLGVGTETLRRTDFERAFHVTGGVTLNTQYRMEKAIGDLVSECFYKGVGVELETGRPRSPAWYAELAHPWNRTVTWVDSGSGQDAFGEEEIARGKFVNRYEVRLLLLLIERLAERQVVQNLRSSLGENKSGIGVITMYRAQKDLIEKELSKAEWAAGIRSLVRVDTVDSYQGQENRIVLLSLVRDNPRELEGFMEDQARINVSISRAQERLIVVGAARMWSQRNRTSPLGQVFDFIRARESEGHPEYAVVRGTTLSPIQPNSEAEAAHA